MKNTLQKGFTLIELLVVIAVLAVLASGVLVLIDPIDKISQANDSKVQQDLGAMGRASEAYAVTHAGFYPTSITDLVTSGELKIAPVAPTGYAYTFTAAPASCTAGTTCTSVVITAPLKAKRYSATPFERYETATNKNCQTPLATTAC